MYYIGTGEVYYPGVPMRDLTDAEWRELPQEVRDALLANKLFAKSAPEKSGLSVEEKKEKDEQKALRAQARSEAQSEPASTTKGG